MGFLSAFFDIIILLGAFQGFIISSLLFFTKGKQLPNRLLGTLIFLMALACLNLYLTGQTWFETSTTMQVIEAIVPFVIIMPVGPLVYFYVISSLNADFKLIKKDKRHFYSVIIDLSPSIFVILIFAAALTGALRHTNLKLGIYIDTYNVYADIPRWLSLSVYLFFSSRCLNTFKKQQGAQKLSVTFKWLRQLVNVFIAFQIIWFIFLVPYVIPAYSVKLLSLVNWYPLYIPLVLLIYWLGIKGYLVMQAQPVKALNAPIAIPFEMVDQTVSLLKNAMVVDLLYLNPDLNLATLSQHTGVPQKTISAVLNQHLHKSFNEFLNEYRVNAFKEKIKSAGVRHLTMAGIAFECGFNSQSTFQRTFRQVTGLSPSEFKNSLLQAQ